MSRKSAKMQFFTFKMTAISQGQGHFKSCSPYPSNVSTKFHWGNQNRFGEKWKKVIFSVKYGHHFVESLAIWPKFHTALQDDPRYVHANMVGISVTLRMLGPVQGLEHAFWILLRWFQAYQNI